MSRKVHAMLIRVKKDLGGWEGERFEETKVSLGETQH